MQIGLGKGSSPNQKILFSGFSLGQCPHPRSSAFTHKNQIGSSDFSLEIARFRPESSALTQRSSALTHGSSTIELDRLL